MYMIVVANLKHFDVTQLYAIIIKNITSYYDSHSDSNMLMEMKELCILVS